MPVVTSGNGEDIIRRIKLAFNHTERNNARTTWDLLAEFIHNNQSGIFLSEESKGTRRTNRVYDSTAMLASDDLASTMHSTIMSPLQQWALPAYANPVLANNKDALAWLEEVIKLIYTEFNESNLDQEVGKSFKFLTSLGMFVFLHDVQPGSLPGDFQGFRFESIHLSECAIEEDSLGQTNALYRKRKFTAQQLAERWPDKIPSEVKEKLEHKPNDEFVVYWCIKPNSPKKIKLNKDGLAPPMNRPYIYYWVMEKGGHIMEEGGYYEFPIYTPRWSKLPGEVYGRGPGHLALPTIRTLNKTKDLHLRGLAKVVDPPILANQSAVLQNLNLLPGRLSVVSDVTGVKQFVGEGRYDVSQLNMQEMREEVKSLFYLDKLFLPPRTETGEMSATEIIQRLEQHQKALGPIMNRLNHEFLTPLFVRSFKIMLRAGALPQPPDVVLEQGVDIEIKVVNQLARAQQFEEVSNTLQWVEQAAMIAQLTANESVMDLVNADGIVKHIKSIRGVPEIALNSNDTIQQIRQQRAQQAQEAQRLAAAQGISEVAKNLGEGGLE
jgi:hypothetical protein